MDKTNINHLIFYKNCRKIAVSADHKEFFLMFILHQKLLRGPNQKG
jgi:hypothetical protein